MTVGSLGIMAARTYHHFQYTAPAAEAALREELELEVRESLAKERGGMGGEEEMRDTAPTLNMD